MPYITKESRTKFDNILNEFKSLDPNSISSGELNYIISSMTWHLFNHHPSYSKANDLIGTLECSKMEFYRQLVTPYENEKLILNGNII